MVTSSSATRLYCRQIPRLTFGNFMLCHTETDGGRLRLLSQPLRSCSIYPQSKSECVELMELQMILYVDEDFHYCKPVYDRPDIYIYIYIYICLNILSEVANFWINPEIRILSGYFNKPIQCGLNFLFWGGGGFGKFPAFSS